MTLLFNFTHTAEEIRREIEKKLTGLGILCRVFGRAKTPESFERKLNSCPSKYQIGGKLIQDLVGIRVVLYFSEDIEIVKSLLDSRYERDFSSSTIDAPSTVQFTVARYNLIYKLPTDIDIEFSRYEKKIPIDKTFEVQIRSILSEGWHEVDHDLRYKCQENWENQFDLSRAFNGINATLQTAEWSLRKIFDDLSYRHYKSANWGAMLQNRLRLRVDTSISHEFIKIFNENSNIAKNYLRIDRSILLKIIHSIPVSIPLTLDNIICIWNFTSLNNEQITNLTPPVLLKWLQDANQK